MLLDRHDCRTYLIASPVLIPNYGFIFNIFGDVGIDEIFKKTLYFGNHIK